MQNIPGMFVDLQTRLCLWVQSTGGGGETHETDFQFEKGFKENIVRYCLVPRGQG